MKTIYMTIILLIELFFNISFAQVKETKLVPIDGQLNDGFGATVASDGTEDDKMGSSVFIEGDQVLVGAPIQEADEKYLIRV